MIFTGGPQERTRFLEDFDVPTTEVLGSFADEALRFSPFSSILRGFEQDAAQTGRVSLKRPEGAARGRIRLVDDSPDPITNVLSIEEQDERLEAFGLKGQMKAVEGQREAVFDLRVGLKQEEVANRLTRIRASGFQMVGGFGAGIIASFFDPLNVASAFIPVIGPARFAGALKSAVTPTQRALVRARFGAVQGFVGAGVVEPIVAFQARAEQADYTLAHTVMNLAFGTALGAGLHSGFGAIGDAIKARRSTVRPISEEAQAFLDLPRVQQEEMMRVWLGLSLSDRNITVGPSLFDLMNNPRLADAGLVNQGQSADVRVDFVGEDVIVNGTVIEADVRARAVKDNPGLFAEIESIKKKQGVLRSQIDDLIPRRVESDEVRDIDTGIEALRLKQTKQNRRKAKKTEARINSLEIEKEALLARLRQTDTAPQARYRQALVDADLELRDRATAVSAALTAARDKLGKALAPETRTVQRATGLSITDEVARALAPQNNRLVNFAALEERTAKFGGGEERQDLSEVQSETQDILDEINTFSSEVGDTTVAASVKRIVADETENVTLAEGHADALRAAFACRTG
jgi:hypothetical protein